MANGVKFLRELRPEQHESADEQGVGQQIVGQQCMQVEDRIAVKSYVVGVGEETFDRVFAIEDDLRFERLTALGSLPEIQSDSISGRLWRLEILTGNRSPKCRRRQ